MINPYLLLPDIGADLSSEESDDLVGLIKINEGGGCSDSLWPLDV